MSNKKNPLFDYCAWCYIVSASSNTHCLSYKHTHCLFYKHTHCLFYKHTHCLSYKHTHRLSYNSSGNTGNTCGNNNMEDVHICVSM